MTLDELTEAKDKGLTEPGKENSDPTSAAEKATSKIDVAKQYSGAEAKKLLEDALSADDREQKSRAEKAEAEVKRLTGVTSDLTTKYTTVSSQVAELLKASNEAEAEKVKDDPVALGSLRARQANREEALRLESIKADYEGKNTTFAEREQALKIKESSINIKLAATAAGVDEKTLADLVPDGDSERLKKAVNILKQTGIDPVTGRPRPSALTTRPASALSAGGGPNLASPDDKIIYGLGQQKK